MIRIPKKQLYSLFNQNQRHTRYPKIVIHTIAFLLFYSVLPIFLTIRLKSSPVRLLIFYLANIFIAIFLFKKNSDKKYRLEYQIQNLEEKLNVLSDDNFKELKNRTAINARIARYNSLKKIVEEINKNLELDFAAEKLVLMAFSLISNKKGAGVLYLADSQTHRISLFKTKKEDESLIIKAKEGDIFDHWVLRHGVPLLIEDIKKDFRFDLERLAAEDLRPISSLVSSGLMSEHKLLGILRLDNPKPYFYSQDDLRFLTAICDVGAVALENSILFQETKSLAIHDGLTSLYTKGYFLERLNEEARRSSRQKTVFSLLMLDIDYFKNYNDKFGHTAGDNVLIKVSRSISEFLKEPGVLIGRFGGEEFCIILPGIDKEKAFTLAAELCKKIEKEKIILRKYETRITVSIGVAAFPADAEACDELIIKADKALYQAKEEGRNRVCRI